MPLSVTDTHPLPSTSLTLPGHHHHHQSAGFLNSLLPGPLAAVMPPPTPSSPTIMGFLNANLTVLHFLSLNPASVTSQLCELGLLALDPQPLCL